MRSVPFTLFIIVTIFSPVTASQDTQPAGLMVSLASGNLDVWGGSGPQYLIRSGYWPTSWLSVGAEISSAPNIPNTWGETKKYFAFSRQDVYLGLHLRNLRYLHPYIIGTLGRHKQIDGPPYNIDGTEFEETTYIAYPGYTFKLGLTLELQRLSAYLEFGGGSLGSGHVESNIGFSYPLKPLPVPNTFSEERSRLSVVFSTFGSSVFSRYYGGGGGMELTATDRDNGREYGFGAMFLDGPSSHTGMLSMKIGWPIKKLPASSLASLQGVYGFQTLFWLEADPDLILPGAYLSLQPSVHIGRMVTGLKLGSIASYSIDSGIFIGFTYGLVIGMNL